MAHDRMEYWRLLNLELTAMYQDRVNFGQWKYLWERFHPTGSRTNTFNPRVVARWWVNDLYAV